MLLGFFKWPTMRFWPYKRSWIRSHTWEYTILIFISFACILIAWIFYWGSKSVGNVLWVDTLFSVIAKLQIMYELHICLYRSTRKKAKRKFSQMYDTNEDCMLANFVIMYIIILHSESYLVNDYYSSWLLFSLIITTTCYNATINFILFMLLSTNMIYVLLINTITYVLV